MKKRIIALMVAMFYVISSVGAFAENTDVPTTEELRKQLTENYKDKDFNAIKKNSKLDYRDVIQKTEKITVHIDENDMWEYKPEMLGFQVEMTDHYEIFYDKNGNVKQEFVDFIKKTGKISVLRLGGTASTKTNFFTSAIGPVNNRSAKRGISYGSGTYQIAFDQVGPHKMGIPEWIKLMQMVNGDNSGMLMPCINPMMMTEEEIANFVHYIYDDKDESKWGAMRAADGFEEPIKIWYWELGNENDPRPGTDRLGYAAELYVDAAKKAANIITSIEPDAKIAVLGMATAPWGHYFGIENYSKASWTNWHMSVMPELLEVADAFTYHPYYDGYAPEFAYMFADVAKADIDKMVAEKDIRDENGNLKDIKLVNTEHSRFYSPTIPATTELSSALSISSFFNMSFARPWVDGAAIHCSHGVWCAVWLTLNGNFYMTPTAKMMKMYEENAGDRICKVDWEKTEEDGTVYRFSENMNGNAQKFSVVAMPSGEHELKVFMTCKEAYQNAEVTFDFAHHNYTLVGETRLSAPNIMTYPIDEETEALTTVETKELNIANCTSYTTRGAEIVCLTFRTDDHMLQLGETATESNGGDEISDAAEATELAFDDIAGSYAKNEITALANAGIINGRNENTFAPTDTITRAEFSYLLAKIMNCKEYGGKVWKDVPADAWYASLVNGLYIEGIFDGEYLRPEENITIGEIMSIVGRLCKSADKKLNISGFSGKDIYIDSDSAYAVNKGLFSKIMENKTINVDDYATREDISALIFKLEKMI